MKLTLSDGRVLEAPEPKPFDIVSFERKYKLSASTLSEASPIEHAFFLSWSALRRVGQYTEDFETFLQALDDFEEDEDTADPLVETPPTSSE